MVKSSIIDVLQCPKHAPATVPGGIYLFKVIMWNDIILVSSLLTLNRFHTRSGVFIIDFEQVNAGWGADASILNVINKFFRTMCWIGWKESEIITTFMLFIINV